jgi:hypothetical protein
VCVWGGVDAGLTRSSPAVQLASTPDPRSGSGGVLTTMPLQLAPGLAPLASAICPRPPPARPPPRLLLPRPPEPGDPHHDGGHGAGPGLHPGGGGQRAGGLGAVCRADLGARGGQRARDALPGAALPQPAAAGAAAGGAAAGRGAPLPLPLLLLLCLRCLCARH